MKLLTLAEAAPLVGLSADTLRRRCRDGLVRGAELRGKTWLIPERAVETIRRRPPGRRPGMSRTPIKDA